MKVIIDLIEDIRESIGNADEYLLAAGLLKEDTENKEKLIYAGEALLSRYKLDKNLRQLIFKIDSNNSSLTVGELIPHLLIADMDTMMYELKIDVNNQYKDMEIIGFGKNDEQKRYVLFIKI